MSMPDESCRKCGKPLYFFAKCEGCRRTIQEICLACGTKTLPQVHNCTKEKVSVPAC